MNLAGGEVDTAPPMGPGVFSVTVARAPMEVKTRCERIACSVAKCRAGGTGPDRRRPTSTDSHIGYAVRLVQAGEADPQIARDPARLSPVLTSRCIDIFHATVPVRDPVH